MRSLSETTESKRSSEEIYHPVLQFVHSTRNLVETGTVLNKGRSGRPRTPEESIDCVRQAGFSRSPTKCFSTAAGQLELPHSTVHKVLRKNLPLYTLAKCNCCRHLSQSEESLQLTSWKKFLRMDHFSSEFVLVTRQTFMCQEN